MIRQIQTIGQSIKQLAWTLKKTCYKQNKHKVTGKGSVLGKRR